MSDVGVITTVVSDRGFGFIKTDHGDVFFHVSALRGLEFGDQLVELNVQFEVEQAAKGLRAVNVRALH